MLTGPQNMPKFSDRQLSPEEKKDIIAYVRSSSETMNPGGYGLGGFGPASEGMAIFIIGMVAAIAVDSFDEALSVANGVDQGLSASLVTRDFKKAMHYAERIEAGVVKVNQISTGLALHVPFGGVKQSSTDTFREQGTAALDFYTRSKTVYLDWSA